MASSRREMIFEKVVMVLETIQGVGQVTRGKIDALSIQRYPAMFVYPGVDEVTDYLGDYIDRNMEVFVFAWLKAQSDVALELETFLPKAQQALAVDHTLTGTVIDFNESSVSERLLTDDQGEGGFIINYDCKYRVLRTDPYS